MIQPPMSRKIKNTVDFLLIGDLKRTEPNCVFLFPLKINSKNENFKQFDYNKQRVDYGLAIMGLHLPMHKRLHYCQVLNGIPKYWFKYAHGSN